MTEIEKVAILQTDMLEKHIQNKLVMHTGCAVISSLSNCQERGIEMVLMVNNHGILQLSQVFTNNKNTICIKNAAYVDFLSNELIYKGRTTSSKKSPIAKALGLQHSYRQLNVLDTTAGFGSDAFILAYLGCSVTMLERSAIVSSLLEDGLKRAVRHGRTKPIIERLKLKHLCACNYLRSQTTTDLRHDIIYIDPMFPKKTKSAASKKEMQYLQTLLNGDKDADLLLTLALEKARYRIIVKRPNVAPALAGISPNFRLSGKSSRLDVYCVKSLKNDK